MVDFQVGVYEHYPYSQSVQGFRWSRSGNSEPRFKMLPNTGFVSHLIRMNVSAFVTCNLFNQCLAGGRLSGGLKNPKP